MLSKMAIMLWFHALAVTPLAQAVALSFATSMFLTVGAAVFLAKRLVFAAEALSSQALPTP